MEHLAAAGIGSIAPNLRGYAAGTRSLPRRDYDVSCLLADLVGILEAYPEPVHVVGHDWGGSLLWSLRHLRPDLIASATIVSSPHPADLAWAATHTRQALKSWYIAAIGIPQIPELFVKHGLARFLRATGLPAERADYYQSRMRAADAAAAPLAWYRQMLAAKVRPAPTNPPQRVDAPAPPSTYLWGAADAFLGRAAAERTRDRIDGLTFIEIEDGGHWLPETHPEPIAAAVISQIRNQS